MKRNSFVRLLHYIFQLESRAATAADWTLLTGYVDALRDNEIITKPQARFLLETADRCRRHRITHFEPYQKIPYLKIKSDLEEVLDVEPFLKSCPICDSQPNIFTDDEFWFVMCPECDKHGALTAIVNKLTKKEAADAWNSQTVEDIEHNFPELKEAREKLEKEENHE